MSQLQVQPQAVSNNNILQMPQAQQATAHFTILVEIEGFPITVQVEGRADALSAMIGKLKSIGAQPPAKAAAPVAAVATTAPEQEGPPVCPVHGGKMKESRKPGSWFCTRKQANGEYCEQSVKR